MEALRTVRVRIAITRPTTVQAARFSLWVP